MESPGFFTGSIMALKENLWKIQANHGISPSRKARRERLNLLNLTEPFSVTAFPLRTSRLSESINKVFFQVEPYGYIFCEGSIHYFYQISPSRKARRERLDLVNRTIHCYSLSFACFVP